MGFQFAAGTELKMKSLLLVFVAVVSGAPEADPAFAYSVGTPLAYNYHIPHVYHAAAPLQYVLPAAGCTNNDGAFVPCNVAATPLVAGLPVLGAAPAPAAAAEAEPAVVEARKKREAEAEAAPEADAEADPWLSYYGLHHPYAPYTYSYGFPYHYGYAGYPHHSAYVYGRKKREAEAEPEADAWGYYSHPYAYAAYHPYAYSYVHPYHYAGCRNNYGALVPCA